jgi:polysaccharide biosynthesis/export protein
MRWLVLVGAVTLSGCGAPRMIDTGRVGIVAPEALPPPTQEDLSRGRREHLLGTFDRISVDVFGLPDLTRQVQVDANGQIALPLAGRLTAAGLTPGQLEAAVAERLRTGHVRNPLVTISLLETVSQSVTVDGEVRQPGTYPIQGNMTLMRAIARAQGTTEYARTSFVVLFRTVNGRQMATLYDLRAIRLGAYEDPHLYAQDLVVVGTSEARRLFPQIIQGVGLLLSPLITTLGTTSN